ncbi:MAG TPA: glycosyltransferase [Candidatus Krumholzibacteria bacterium]|nr:glycosyltransferase [Candidatus Krumholzibacteria bacterium]
MDLSALLERPSKPSAEVGIDRPCTVLLPTLGSAGDVHPVLAVARKLRARGHRPVVVTSSWFERACRDEGIEFEQLLPDAAFERAARDPDIWHPWRGFRVLARDVIVPAMRPLFEIVERRAEQTDDLVVASSVLCLGARLAHEKLGVPQVSMHVQPVVLRSREDRVGTPHLHFPRTGPRWQKDLAYAVADAAIIDPALCPELNAYRNWLGLPRVRRPFDGWIHSTQRVVGLWPDWYAPVQPDWPDDVTLTDFPLFDPGEDAPLDPAVQDFLGAGSPPVVFTGGSANVHMDELLRAGLRSCRASGERGLFLLPEPESLGPLPDGFAAFGFTPLGALLPHCRAVVHHGGIGTTARVLRSGLPQVVVPHSHDQPDNALRVEALGAGAVVPSAKLDGKRLEAALRRELNRDRTAAPIAAHVAGSADGPGDAAAAITRLVRDSRV